MIKILKSNNSDKRREIKVKMIMMMIVISGFLKSRKVIEKKGRKKYTLEKCSDNSDNSDKRKVTIVKIRMIMMVVSVFGISRKVIKKEEKNTHWQNTGNSYE